jgi:hypothetical protein
VSVRGKSTNSLADQSKDEMHQRMVKVAGVGGFVPVVP